MTEDSIDLSWLKRIENPTTYFLKEIPTSIDVLFIYLNKLDHIEKITREELSVKNGIVEKEDIIGIIQKRRQPSPNTRYKLCDTLLFLMDTIDPIYITDFIKSDNNVNLVSLPIINDIKIRPTITFFHDMNSLYVILQEMIPITKPKLLQLPSILKSPVNSTTADTNKKTKRVRISPDVIERNKKTEKRRDN
jgi:hypothetical protein